MASARFRGFFGRLAPPLLAASAAAASAPAQTTQDVNVDLLVTDREGRPIAGVEFGDFWTCDGGGMTPGMICNGEGQPEFLISDAQGRVRGSWTEDPFGTPLLALNRERTLGARVFSEDAQSAHSGPGRIVLSETSTIRLLLAGGSRSVRLQASEVSDPANRRWSGWYFHAMSGETLLSLPGGSGSRWILRARTRMAEHGRTLTVPHGARGMDLGTITLPTSPLERIGETLPDWHVDTANGVPLERALPCDFRGRPLLVWFRAPNHSVDLEREAALQRAIAGHPRAGEFRMLILELDPAAKDRARKSQIRETCPILTDWSGRTEAVYGPVWNGELMLLGADGRLLDAGHVATFERSLGILDRALPPTPVPPR